MNAYAGYHVDQHKIMESSSGGAVNEISTSFIRSGGIVYGVAYSQDFYSAVYQCAEKEVQLKKFLGSKYVYADKFLKDNEKKISVYEDAVSKLQQDFKVLFVGLGCDIAALNRLVKLRGVNADKLFTVELLCDGVTNEIVQKAYVSDLEKIYRSKVIQFSVRYKKEKWIPPYIFVKFDNGEEYTEPFYESDYGFAFANYKKKACYNCPFKNENHMGDIIAGDFWGCLPGMEEYNEKGVSLLLERSSKGSILLNELKNRPFFLKKVDENYALYNNKRYFTPHEYFIKWDIFDKVLRESGLRKAVRECAGIAAPARYKNTKISEMVLWGAGNSFHQYIALIHKAVPKVCVVDSNRDKWGEELEYGIICEAPDVLREKKEIFVLIMIENTKTAFQVVNQLLDWDILEFDHIKNWIYYREC